MKDLLSMILLALLAIAAVMLGTYGYLYLYRDVAPKFAEAERQVFVNTPSYVRGKITHLSQLESDYRRAKDDEIRETLRDLIRREAATVDHAELPGDLRRFVESL